VVLSKPDFRKMTTVEAVCDAFPQRVQALLDALDLSRVGLEAVRKAAESNDQVAACNALLDYYRTAATANWLRSPKKERDEKTIEAAERVLDDTCTFYGQTDRVPRRPDGGLDWEHLGPTKDIEWASALNRHFHIGSLFNAYVQTGRGEFADTMDEHLRDWIVASHPYPGVRTTTTMWRGLEVALRLPTWAAAYFGLQDDPRLTRGTRLLMLATLPEHAHYGRNFHAAGGNWVTMELSSLATIAAAWPEFKQSREWMDYAKSFLTKELHAQVYPDGAQMELTVDYHACALGNFERLARVCRDAQEPLPAEYSRGLESLYNYLAYTLRSDGTGPINNDSDLRDYRGVVTSAAQRHSRPDWTCIASAGTQGRKPDGLPSRVFEWAGQLISRNGLNSESHWSFFDVGPWGIGHQHNDKLHLSIYAYGRDLLVDSGRFSYSGELADRFRNDYALHSRGHNVILIDGCGQAPGPRAADRPLDSSDYLIDPLFDFARGAFSEFAGMEGKATHTRALLYVRDQCWIVVDRITTDRPRAIETLWHFHPKCSVRLAGKAVHTSDPEKGNLRIVSADPAAWNIELVIGQEKPHPQGWYSEKYNTVTKAPTAVCRAQIKGEAVFAWLLVPCYCIPPDASLELKSAEDGVVSIRAEIGGESLLACIPLSGKSQPALTR
jgi:hypothetical protein